MPRARRNIQVGDPFPEKGLLKNWRRPVLLSLMAHCSPPATCVDRDIYEFGVYTGRAMRSLASFVKKRGLATGTMWGFDSFAGLPPDLAPKGNMTFRYFNKRVKYWKDMVSSNGSFAPGAFSVAKLLQTSSVAQMTQRLDEYVNDSRVKWVAGFYNESLTAGLAAARGMRPALYVDVDVDIYVSAYQALDWLCASRLIVPGTLVGYDDWRWGDHRNASERDGEARAHLEVLEQKHGVGLREWAGHERERLAGSGGKLFEVTDVPWPAPATSSAALRTEPRCRRLSLLRAVGNSSACVRGETYGCSADRFREMWVAGGCRGAFCCNGAGSGVCGAPRASHARAGARYVCPCGASSGGQPCGPR